MSHVSLFFWGLNSTCAHVSGLPGRSPACPPPRDAPSEMTYFSWLSAAEGSFISGALCGGTELCPGQANWTLLCNEALLTHARTHTGRQGGTGLENLSQLRINLEEMRVPGFSDARLRRHYDPLRGGERGLMDGAVIAKVYGLEGERRGTFTKWPRRTNMAPIIASICFATDKWRDIFHQTLGM